MVIRSGRTHRATIARAAKLLEESRAILCPGGDAVKRAASPDRSDP
jgi:hypothetical protein